MRRPDRGSRRRPVGSIRRRAPRSPREDADSVPSLAGARQNAIRRAGDLQIENSCRSIRYLEELLRLAVVERRRNRRALGVEGPSPSLHNRRSTPSLELRRGHRAHAAATNRITLAVQDPSSVRAAVQGAPQLRRNLGEEVTRPARAGSRMAPSSSDAAVGLGDAAVDDPRWAAPSPGRSRVALRGDRRHRPGAALHLVLACAPKISPARRAADQAVAGLPEWHGTSAAVPSRATVRARRVDGGRQVVSVTDATACGSTAATRSATMAPGVAAAQAPPDRTIRASATAAPNSTAATSTADRREPRRGAARAAEWSARRRHRRSPSCRVGVGTSARWTRVRRRSRDRRPAGPDLAVAESPTTRSLGPLAGPPVGVRRRVPRPTWRGRRRRPTRSASANAASSAGRCNPRRRVCLRLDRSAAAAVAHEIARDAVEPRAGRAGPGSRNRRRRNHARDRVSASRSSAASRPTSRRSHAPRSPACRPQYPLTNASGSRSARRGAARRRSPLPSIARRAVRCSH